MQSKYEPLTSWLLERPPEPFELSFGEIERVLGFELPASYRRHLPVWYGNRPSTAIWAIGAAGWRARRVDLTAERLLLERIGAPPTVVTRQPLREQTPRRDTSLDAGLWEGDVQSAVAGYLISKGWTLLSMADTGSRQRGDDIRAKKGERVLVVEVKGYPSRAYADPRRVDEVKASHPSAQAKHYVADALVTVLRVLGTRPEVAVAIAFPDVPRYRALLSDLDTPLRRLGVATLLATPTGEVAELIPLED